VSDQPIAVAFFDPATGLHGSARSGFAILFRGDDKEVLDEPPRLARDGEGWNAELAGRAELAFEPISGDARLEGAVARVCQVRGSVDGRRVECLGTAIETSDPPTWSDLDATRAVSALFDTEHAVLAFARRPRGARGHGEEQVKGWLLDGEELRSVEETRLSTLYDGDGRQRNAGLELWLAGEDFPRRVVGEARAGVSLALEGLHVHAAVFAWRMEGRDGMGAYELTVRREPEAAA
jgi:hypothetical protein